MTEISKEPYYGDLEKTGLLVGLFNIPPEQRDESWKRKFLDNVVDASFACGDPQVLTGPDGYPYFQLILPEPGKPFTCYVIRHMKDDFLLANGWGIAVNSLKGQTEWMFSYGDVLNFHLRGEFYTHTDMPELPSKEIIQEKEEVLVGQPSETLFPAQARNVLRRYLKYLGVENVKIMLMNRKKSGTVLQQLVFNLTPEKFDSNERYEQVMRSLGWFLPRHYSYVAMNEKDFKDSFASL
jgi:hypothetical protein